MSPKQSKDSPSKASKKRRVGIKIGEIIAGTGVTRATIHHYVREGLLPEPIKTSRNMALYDPSCVERVLLIKGLQSRTRRSLAEVKTLLADAADHEGIRRLQGLLEVESVRSQVSPLRPEASRGPISADALRARTGLTEEQLEEFDGLGLISRTAQGYSPADVAVADALASLQQAGFDDDHGFLPEHTVLYLDAMRDLLHKEITLFLEVTGAAPEPAEVLAKAELGIERVTPLLLALRRKLMRDFLLATPLSGRS